VIEEEVAPLFAEIGVEAEAEEEKILREAQDKVRRILADSEARIQSATEEASRIMEKQARVDEDRLHGETRMQDRAQRISGMRLAYKRVFEIARERIDRLVGSAHYPDALRALICQALERAPRAAVVSVAPEDVETCRGILRELGKSCQVETARSARGTVIVSTADGKVRVDNSLATRLSMAEAEMETQVTRCLNG
jgi:V/A-type H+/Na+-transporting ATPase subunit E